MRNANKEINNCDYDFQENEDRFIVDTRCKENNIEQTYGKRKKKEKNG